MAGHSKWANIKHRKEKQDKKRGAAWTKCARALIAAARSGGPDPDTNLALRYAIDEAKYANMPKDTIQRAIEKGAGAGAGDNYEPVTYEGFGPGGVAILVDGLTDNRTRTVAAVRSIFTKVGCNLGQEGSVSYMFATQGRVVIEAGKTTEDRLMELAIEAGADDVEAPESDDGAWIVTTSPAMFLAVREAVESAGIEIASAEITKSAQTTVELRGEDARKLLKLVESLEADDDVQKVHTNADIPDDELASMD